jgi:glucosylceramidase
VIVDKRNQTVFPGTTYYQLGQASRFIARGAVRVESNSFVTYGLDRVYYYEPSIGLDDVAFVNPNGGLALVAYNSSPNPIQFAVTWHGYHLIYRQPAGAMTTFTWR